MKILRRGSLSLNMLEKVSLVPGSCYSSLKVLFPVFKYQIYFGEAQMEIRSKVRFYIFVDAVIDDKTCEERLWDMKRRGETNFYLCEINRDMVIDATYKGNKSRYINHSCSPNTEMQKWFFSIRFLLNSMHYLCSSLT